jgi:hypothetical protein
MGHLVTPKPSRTGRRVWSCGTCGDTGALPCWEADPTARGDARALLHREVDLEPWDMWRHRSHSLPSGGPGRMWRLQSPPAPGGRSGAAVTPEPFPAGCGVWRGGTRLKSCKRGYPVCRVPTNESQKSSSV